MCEDLHKSKIVGICWGYVTLGKIQKDARGRMTKGFFSNRIAKVTTDATTSKGGTQPIQPVNIIGSSLRQCVKSRNPGDSWPLDPTDPTCGCIDYNGYKGKDSRQREVSPGPAVWTRWPRAHRNEQIRCASDQFSLKHVRHTEKRMCLIAWTHDVYTWVVSRKTNNKYTLNILSKYLYKGSCWFQIAKSKTMRARQHGK